MKSFIRILISVFLIFGMVSCSTGTNEEENKDVPAVEQTDGKKDNQEQSGKENETGSSTEKVEDSENGSSTGKTGESENGSSGETENQTGNSEENSQSGTQPGTGGDNTQTGEGGENSQTEEGGDNTQAGNEDIPWYEMEFDLTTPSIELPASVGENSLKGKSFKQIIRGGDANRREKTWIFNDNTVIMKDHRFDTDMTNETTYKYAYNAEKNVIYLALVGYSGDGYSFTNLAEWWEYMKARKEEYAGVPSPKSRIEQYLRSMAYGWSTLTVYQYTISDNSISFERYFDPDYPDYSGFWLERENPKNNTLMNFKQGEGLWLWPENSTGNGDGYHCIYPELKNGKISGEVIYKDEVIGTVKGTYKTTGEGTSGCTMTLVFTELPELMTEFELNKEYVLKK